MIFLSMDGGILLKCFVRMDTMYCMKLESCGILIGMRPLNERDAIARIFSRDFGLLSGVLRAGVIAKKNRPLVGQVGIFSWNARLDSQLGTFHWEAEKNMAAPIFLNQGAMACMNAAFDILAGLLPEREAYGDLYDETLKLMCALGGGDVAAYLGWEVALLRELGYALDLGKCSGCGATQALNYLSPRTGRAVCDTCAQPYLDKLYRLPVSLGVTFRFLENVCLQQGTQIPHVRRLLKFD